MNNIKRHFFLGDNWLYFKVYTGFKTADSLLKEVINPLAQHLKQHQIISHWFFIRYGDPDFHLRVRFHLPDVQKIGTAILLINKSLQSYFQNGLVWKIQYDVYNREMERYGENSMDLSEQIFCADSEMIVELLGSETNYLLGLRAIDELLTVFDYDIERKHTLLNTLQDSFAKEFQIEGKLRRQFSDNFRENRKEITRIMTAKIEENSWLAPILQKSEKIKENAGKILEYSKNDTLQIPLDDLLSSYIHMMLNRFFRTQSRKQELVLYDYLYRYYDSEINKLKYKDKNKQQ